MSLYRSSCRHFCAWLLLCLWFFALVAASPAQAHGPSADPLSEVNFEQKLNEQIPLDLAFRDEAGQAIQLGDYLGEKPVILVFAYYGCKTLCSVVLEELVESLRALKFDVGDQFGVVTVSLDPRDTSTLAAEKKAIQLEHYGRPGAAAGWRFLTGEHAAIDQLAGAIGFRYAYDAQLDQYAHPAGIVVLTPEGKISRYFFGLEYSPTDLRLGLVEASANKIGSFVDQVLLRCFQYDPVAGRYTPIVMNIVRLVGLTTALTLGTSILVMLRWERHRKKPQLDHTIKQGRPT